MNYKCDVCQKVTDFVKGAEVVCPDKCVGSSMIPTKQESENVASAKAKRTLND